MKITDSDLPVFVKLTPNQHHQKMDIDLYAYSEKQFTSYYFPNKAERNHINNIPEQILITSVDKYYENGEWNFFEVYGSTDSDYDNMDYKLQVTKNYVSNNLLKQILLIFAFTIAISFVLGITISFILSFRHQILYFLRIRSTPHRNGASKRQIKKLKIIKYKTNMTNTDQLIDTDHTQCIICLDDYTNDDKIRILRCGHNFHVHCSDEWLFLNNKCPLCYQNIVSAQDMHNMDAIDNNIVRAESVEANDVQDE